MRHGCVHPPTHPPACSSTRREHAPSWGGSAVRRLEAACSATSDPMHPTSGGRVPRRLLATLHSASRTQEDTAWGVGGLRGGGAGWRGVEGVGSGPRGLDGYNSALADWRQPAADVAFSPEQRPPPTAQKRPPPTAPCSAHVLVGTVPQPV